MQIILLVARSLFALVAAFASCCVIAQTQSADAIEFIPAQPTSADTVFVRIPRSCANSNYVGPTYRVSTANGKIRIDISLGPPPPCAFGAPPAPALLVDIGRLPAGSYSVDIAEARVFSFEVVFATIASNLPFAVTDHRAAKTAPAVRLNYSDHWWDPNNSGRGLFVWQDARDQMLAAWFTYGSDGLATWYTIQSGTWTTATRYEGKLLKASRPPNAILGGLVDGPGPTSLLQVGVAMLDFSGDDGALSGAFTYKLDSAAAALTRTIRRFGK